MEEKKKRVVAFLLVIVVLLIAAALASRMEKNKYQANIKNFNKKFLVEITNLKVKATSGEATNIENKKTNDAFNKGEVNLKAKLKNKGDSITYSLIITNKGDLNSKLTMINTGLDDIKDKNKLELKTEGLKIGDTIDVNDSKPIDVTISLIEDSSEDIKANINLSLEFSK